MWLFFALFAAIAFGVRGALYHKTSTLQLDRNPLLFGVFASGAILNSIMALLTHSTWSTASLIGVQMGVFSFIASACMYKGFAVGKASIVAVLTALPAVVVVIAAYVIWGEKLHFMQLIAFIILIAGVLTIRYSNDISLSNLQGAQWGLLTMIFFAGNDLTTKWSTLENADPYTTLICMFVTGAACFGGMWWFEHKKQQNIHDVNASFTIHNSDVEQAKPSYSSIKIVGIGMLVGITNAVGMMLNMQAFHLGKTGLVSAVIALNVIVILLYTRFIVREKFSRTEIIGMVLAICGILLIHLFK